MIVSISAQVFVFLYSIASGIAIAFVYDVFRILRKTIKTGSIVTYIQDLVYWTFAALIMFLMIHISNDGEIRAFLFIGAFIGVILYVFLFSGIIMRSSIFVIKLFAYLIKSLIFIISYPVRMILKLLAIPARKLAGAGMCSLRKICEKGKARLSLRKTHAKGRVRLSLLNYKERIVRIAKRKQRNAKRKQRNVK